MGSSPDEDDVERVDSDYVDPESTSRDEIRADLEDAGIEGDAATAFESRMLDADAVVDDVRDRTGGRANTTIVTRDEVSNAVEDSTVPHAADREGALVDAAAQEIGAPSESELQAARGAAARNVDDDGTIRSNPDLDPLGGSDGREIGPVSEVTRRTGGRGGGFTEGIEPTGSGRGTYYVEDEGGTRYPLAEVDL